MRPISFIAYILLPFLLFSCSMEKRRYSKGFHITGHYYFQTLKKSNITEVDQKISEQEILPEGVYTFVDSNSIISSKSITNNINNHSQNKLVSEPKELCIPNSNQPDSVLIISEKVGDVIDVDEEKKYHLFRFWYWGFNKFSSAQFKQDEKGHIYVVATMQDGSTKIRTYSKKEYKTLARKDRLLNEEQKQAKRKKDIWVYLITGIIFALMGGATLLITDEILMMIAFIIIGAPLLITGIVMLLYCLLLLAFILNYKKT